MNVEALHGDTNLATVLERAIKQLLCGFFRIHIIQHDTGIVTTQLQSDALQQARCTSHDLGSGFGRTGEGDFSYIRMSRHRRAQIVGVGDKVNHPGRNNVFDQLCKPQRA